MGGSSASAARTVRECGQTGDIVVALKGNAVPRGRRGIVKARAGGSDHARLLQSGRDQARMERHARPTATPTPPVTEIFPEGFALWRINPKHYDRKKDEAFGGRLYATEPSPPMVAIDKQCNVWACQDKVPKMLRVDYKTGEAVQHDVSLPEGWLEMTGPAIACARRRRWTTLLGGDGAMIRISPTGRSRGTSCRATAAVMSPAKYIHMAFVSIPERWFIFNNEKWIFPSTNNLLLISMNLVDDKAINAITYITFNPLSARAGRRCSGAKTCRSPPKLLLPPHRDRPRPRAAEECQLRCLRARVVAPLPDAAVPHRELQHVGRARVCRRRVRRLRVQRRRRCRLEEEPEAGLQHEAGQVKPMEEMNEQKQKAFRSGSDRCARSGGGPRQACGRIFPAPGQWRDAGAYWAKITGGESPLTEEAKG